MKILNFGSCNIDFVYKLDHIVTIGETETSNSMQVFPGGKGLNQSVALAKAGMEVYHAGCIGTDGEIFLTCQSRSKIDDEIQQNRDIIERACELYKKLRKRN